MILCYNKNVQIFLDKGDFDYYENKMQAMGKA